MAKGAGVIVSRADGKVVGQSPDANTLVGPARGRTCWGMMSRVPGARRLPCNEGCVADRLESDDPVESHSITLRGQAFELRCAPVNGHVVTILTPEKVAPPAEWDRLTPREVEVLRLMAEGLNGTEIAQNLGISPGTVRAHVEHMRARLDCRTRAGLVAKGFRLRYLG